PFATSGTDRVRDCGGNLKLRNARSTVVVSPARTVSPGYFVGKNMTVMLDGGSAAIAPPAHNTRAHNTTKKTAPSRRIMSENLPDAVTISPPRRAVQRPSQ